MKNSFSHKIDDTYGVQFSIDKDNDVRVCIFGPSYNRCLSYIPSHNVSAQSIEDTLKTARTIVTKRKSIQRMLYDTLSGSDAKLLSESEQEVEDVLK